jgi:lipid II:glycine glycyltransferase (peptidoglycan interpeptide bridge formation enzyme)
MAAINAQGEIEGAIPFLSIKSLLNKERWISLPFTDHCAPLFLNEAILQNLTDHLVTLTAERNNLSIELRGDYPIRSSFYRNADFVQHRIKLAPDALDVSKRIKPTDFRLVKMAEDKGVRVTRGCDDKFMKEFYQLHLQTRRRKGVPIQPWKFFDNIVQNVTQHDLGFILLAYKDGKCISGCVFFCWNKILVYKYAASIDIARQLHAMDLLLWKAIQWGCTNGYEWMDMGRTDIDDVGLKNYKHRWGAEVTPLTYISNSEKPQKTNSSQLMKLMKLVIQKSPLWVCRFAGEHLYKYAG